MPFECHSACQTAALWHTMHNVTFTVFVFTSTLATLESGEPFFEDVEVIVTEEGWKYGLGLRIGVEAGRPVLSMITIDRGLDQKPLVPKDLAHLPLQRVFSAACEQAAMMAARHAGREDQEAVGRAAGALARRRRQPDDELLRKVAEVVRLNPGRTQRAVQKELTASAR